MEGFIVSIIINKLCFQLYRSYIIFELLLKLVMISRTLGLEFGGSIGTLFFLANIVGSALAITGCTESLMNNFGPGGYFSNIVEDGPWWRFLICTLINTSMLIVCLIGAGLFAKTSVIILGIVTVVLLSTYISFLAEGFTTVSIFKFASLITS